MIKVERADKALFISELSRQSLGRWQRLISPPESIGHFEHPRIRLTRDRSESREFQQKSRPESVAARGRRQPVEKGPALDHPEHVHPVHGVEPKPTVLVHAAEQGAPSCQIPTADSIAGPEGRSLTGFRRSVGNKKVGTGTCLRMSSKCGFFLLQLYMQRLLEPLELALNYLKPFGHIKAVAHFVEARADHAGQFLLRLINALDDTIFGSG